MNEHGHLPKADRTHLDDALRHRLAVWYDKAYEDDNLFLTLARRPAVLALFLEGVRFASPTRPGSHRARRALPRALGGPEPVRPLKPRSERVVDAPWIDGGRGATGDGSVGVVGPRRRDHRRLRLADTSAASSAVVQPSSWRRCRNSRRATPTISRSWSSRNVLTSATGTGATLIVNR
jgi:hypothetical protein